MVSIGNFFFKYRNLLFIALYGALFLPSPPLFSASAFGENFLWWPILIGLVVTFSGQVIRALTIGLAYIVRGGKDGKVYAEGLVTDGIFAHCRNPLYVGNILMLGGVGILANSLWFTVVIMPLFLFIYQSIVRAEEHFLRQKFGSAFDDYCARVPRWMIKWRGLFKTINSMAYNFKRYILKEHTTFFIWLTGIMLVLLLRYPQLAQYDEALRNQKIYLLLAVLGILYLTVRYLKKSGKLVE